MDSNKSLANPWTRPRAVALMVACLLAGIAGGWIFRGIHHFSQTASAKATSISTPAASSANPAPNAPTAEQLKDMADHQSAPLIAKLNADPKNPDLLVSIGNLYYDAAQYPIAVDYYGRALVTRPSDGAVRTDMATAYWYLGDADKAIAEFNMALKYSPDNPNTLLNRGLVKWKGKHDSAGAIADWKKLLATNPNYASKDQVEKMLAEVGQQTPRPGTID
jgi:tetratricopeptide (TPR) repeat protein